MFSCWILSLLTEFDIFRRRVLSSQPTPYQVKVFIGASKPGSGMIHWYLRLNIQLVLKYLWEILLVCALMQPAITRESWQSGWISANCSFHENSRFRFDKSRRWNGRSSLKFIRWWFQWLKYVGQLLAVVETGSTDTLSTFWQTWTKFCRNTAESREPGLKNVCYTSVKGLTCYIFFESLQQSFYTLVCCRQTESAA